MPRRKRRKVRLAVHRQARKRYREVQKAKPLHKQHDMEHCDLCSFAAMNKTGLAAHKRFKHGRKVDGKKLTTWDMDKRNPKNNRPKNGGGHDGSKVNYNVVGPKSSALMTWEGLNKLIYEKEKELQQLLDMKDALRRIVGLK